MLLIPFFGYKQMIKLTCESNTLLALFLFADFSFSLLFEPRGLCRYMSALTSTRQASRAAKLPCILPI